MKSPSEVVFSIPFGICVMYNRDLAVHYKST